MMPDLGADEGGWGICMYTIKAFSTYEFISTN